jgi:hypothetical protein
LGEGLVVGGGVVVGGVVLGGVVVVDGGVVVGGGVAVAVGLVVAAGLAVGAGVGLGLAVVRSDTTLVAAAGRLAQELAAPRSVLPCTSAKATPVRPPETTKTPAATPKVAAWTRREIIDTPLPG